LGNGAGRRKQGPPSRAEWAGRHRRPPCVQARTRGTKWRRGRAPTGGGTARPGQELERFGQARRVAAWLGPRRDGRLGQAPAPAARQAPCPGARGLGQDPERGRCTEARPASGRPGARPACGGSTASTNALLVVEIVSWGAHMEAEMAAAPLLYPNGGGGPSLPRLRRSAGRGARAQRSSASGSSEAKAADPLRRGSAPPSGGHGAGSLHAPSLLPSLLRNLRRRRRGSEQRLLSPLSPHSGGAPIRRGGP
jgi:hypothetical protein